MVLFEKQYLWCIRPKELVTSMYKYYCSVISWVCTFTREGVATVPETTPAVVKSSDSHNHLRYDQEIIFIVILFHSESFDQEIASLQLSNTKFMPETAKKEIYIYFTTIGKTVCSTLCCTLTIFIA